MTGGTGRHHRLFPAWLRLDVVDGAGVEAEEIAETKLHRIQGSALRWLLHFGGRLTRTADDVAHSGIGLVLVVHKEGIFIIIGRYIHLIITQIGEFRIYVDIFSRRLLLGRCRGRFWFWSAFRFFQNVAWSGFRFFQNEWCFADGANDWITAQVVKLVLATRAQSLCSAFFLRHETFSIV